MNGVIALYKERGMTSHDCISQLRKILHTKKLVIPGHWIPTSMVSCQSALAKQRRFLSC